MSFTNDDVAKRLREIAQLKKLAGENHFRSAAYDRAAQKIEGLEGSIADYVEEERVDEIKGIGSSIANNIVTYAKEGRMPDLEELHDQIPSGLLKWLDISGLGPKNIHKIHAELGISEISELKKACEDGRVASLDGLGEKSARKIIKSIEWMQQHSERCRLDEAAELAHSIVTYLEGADGIEELEVAGSLRRSKETIGDVDLLISADSDYAENLFDRFVEHRRVVDVLGRGDTKSSVRTDEGRQVDLRVVKPEEFPAALLYFTGSKEHNVVLRQRARDRDMSLNEYGLFKLDENGDTDFDQPVPCSSESEIYEKLDLHFIPPELREDRGEFDYFEDNKTMNLLEESEIRGVLHAHSTWSDGRFSIRQMAEACIERGYEYLGISDHSQTAAYAGGLSPDEVREQWEEIDALNEEFADNDTDFQILKGIESDILSDGSLDYNNELLGGFDFIIASVHSNLNMSQEQMMERYHNAIANPHTRIIGHPTGRLLLRRDGANLDMNALIAWAVEHNTAIEINANPWRLDLDWRHGNMAKEKGLISAICPDAHSTDGIDNIRYGVQIARKAKFGGSRILNTKSAAELLDWFRDQ